ncbi:MAG: helix-turn-helix domain-containing protein [Patescibacteria group bacterium]|nr:helix-turn-helix domain-containing protein [Patescibacteria group bacterium]
MPHRLPNYLRAYRKRCGLSQEELALLLGLAEQGTVSHIELYEKVPSSTVFVASEIIFDVPPCDLFPKLYVVTEEAVLQRAKALMARVEARSDLSAEAKLRLLTDLIRRLEGGIEP